MSESQNTLFPVFLKLESLNTLVVGGGNVALEKLKAVFENSPGAKVRIVAKEINPQVREFIRERSISFAERPFRVRDLEEVNLAIVAINDKSVSKAIQEACAGKRILTNVADTPELCDFYLGSIARRGHLKIAVSTNGKSPTIAKRVRDVLKASIPAEIDDVLDNMQKIRNDLKGNFSEKVRILNDLTSVMAVKQPGARGDK